MLDWLRNPNRVGLVLFLIILALVSALVLLLCRPVKADLPAETGAAQNRFSQASRVEAMSGAIHWLVTPPSRFDEKRARVYHGTRAYADAEYRAELSAAFIATGNHFNLPKYLLVTIGYRESIFRPEQVGDYGNSLGIMQVGKYGRARCKKYCKDVDTVDGGIMCGGCWLDKGRSWCGDLMGGLNAYCHGKCSTTKTRGLRAVNIRLRLWAILKEGIVNDRFALAAKLREVAEQHKAL